MFDGQMDVWVTGWMAHYEGVWDLYLFTVSVFKKMEFMFINKKMLLVGAIKEGS